MKGSDNGSLASSEHQWKTVPIFSVFISSATSVFLTFDFHLINVAAGFKKLS